MVATAAELARKLERSAAAVRDITPKAVAGAARQSATVLDAAIRRAAPSGKLTPRRVRVAARARITSGSETALVTPSGPIGLIEADIGPHLIGVGRYSRKRAKSASTNYGRSAGLYLYSKGAAHPVRAPIFHPGTRGKHPWQKGHADVVRTVLPRMRNPVVAAVAEVYR